MDRNMQVRFFWRWFWNSEVWLNFAGTTSFLWNVYYIVNLSWSLVNFELWHNLGAIFKQYQENNYEMDKFLPLIEGWNRNTSKNPKTIDFLKRNSFTVYSFSQKTSLHICKLFHKNWLYVLAKFHKSKDFKTTFKWFIFVSTRAN